ncbi:hypothetical protein ACFLU6_12805, partial [Acidobacteriota bacterium]
PITVSAPFWLDCGDELLFRVIMRSRELGVLPPQYLILPVDGDASDCKCEGPLPQLAFDAINLEEDRCEFGSPPGMNRLVNPGEDVDLRVVIRNTSTTDSYRAVEGVVRSLTEGVFPVQTRLDFPDLPPGQSAPHMWNPLIVNVPSSLECGKPIVFTLTLTSRETGELPPQFIILEIDGDPANCPCKEPDADLQGRGFAVSDDRCVYNGPSSGDRRLNPGEEVDILLEVENVSGVQDYHGVTAYLESLTLGVTPSQASLEFGTIPAGELRQNTAAPLALNLPLSLYCGDLLQFRLTLNSLETGDLPSMILTLPVDGDPADCYCTPVDLFYESYAVEDDRCPYTSPPGSDNLINPGEDVDVRLTIRNGSDSTDLSSVTASINVLTPEVSPSSFILGFGAVPARQAALHTGDPLALSVPSWLTCGDTLDLSMILTSAETGDLPPQYFSFSVDGDPLNCPCEDTLHLSYNSYVLEDDHCSLSSPPGSDGMVNPGEDIDLRISVTSDTLTTALTMVSASLEALTPGVTPVLSSLEFGTVQPGQTVQHQGDPLGVTVPLSLFCGEEISFNLTLYSSESGSLSPEIMTVPVDGDPGLCSCDLSGLATAYRSVTTDMSAGWKLSSLPLNSTNDNERPPFPARISIPGSVEDLLDQEDGLVLYRALLPGDTPVPAIDLSITKVSGGVQIHVE